MEHIFLKVLNMSITAGWLALAVVVLRLLLKKAPKAITVALWALVALRLLLPFSPESRLSLVPSSETVPETILYDPSPTIHSGIPVLNSAINPVISQSLKPEPIASVNPAQVVAWVAARLWLLGMVVMAAYLLFSYLRIRRRVREGMPLEDGVWICDRVETPFILGIFRPKIYLPSHLDPQDREFVITHERAHLKRRDHWWKPLGYLLLSIHWFNPLLWVGYLLLCRDIELACDEKVIRQLGTEAKKPYSETLLRCSVRRTGISACPLAFGEVGVKQRIQAVLNYKKPAFWVVLVAVTAAAILTVGFLTDPKPDVETPTVTEPTSETFPDTNPQQEGTRPPNPVTLMNLKKKFPQYFDLDTNKGLEVYVWQMGKGLYSWGLLPGRNLSYGITELMDLKPASTEEMRAIVASYDLPRNMVTILPFSMPYSSFAYPIDSSYQQQVEALFWQEEITESFYDNRLRAISYDIDGDGMIEECSLGPGPTSGLFTFSISVTQDGELEYFNIFNSKFYTLSFERDNAGVLRLRGEPQDDPSEIVYFDIAIVDGHIQISDTEGPLSYWGEQGPNSPFAPKASTFDEFMAQALEDYYRPTLPDGLLHTQSYRCLSAETVSGTPTTDGKGNVSVTTLYLMVMHCTYRMNAGIWELVTSEITPAVMVVKEETVGSYHLSSYQEPTEEVGLFDLFPGHLISNAKQTYLYKAELQADCDRMALDSTSAGLPE